MHTPARTHKQTLICSNGMDTYNFLKLVKEMRDTQKMYFAQRNRADFLKAKALEKKVDSLIVDVMRNLREPLTIQTQFDF